MAVTFSASPPRPPAIVEASGSQADAAAAAAAVFLGSGGGCGPFGPWDGILVATGQGRMVCGRSGEDWACDDAEDLASDDLGNYCGLIGFSLFGVCHSASLDLV